MNKTILESDIKPCKWCGGKGKWVPLGKPNLISIVCSSCQIGTGFRESKEEALKAWNS